MHPIELRARREALGLSQAELARCLAVTQATVSRWEAGNRAVPDNIGGELSVLEDRLDELTERAINAIDAMDGNAGTLLTYSSDAAMWAAHPEMDGTPAALHRVAMALAARSVDEQLPISEHPGP